VDKILEGCSGKKGKTHCVMEPSCGWICNPAIVWLDEFAVVKILDRIKNPQDVQGLTLYLPQIITGMGFPGVVPEHVPGTLGNTACFLFPVPCSLFP